MKRLLLSLSVITVIAAAGCRTMTEPANYTDPLARTGIGVNESSLWNSQNLDAAVVIVRTEGFNGLPSANLINDARMAFELQNKPAQIGNATMNNVPLTWIDTNGGHFNEDIYGLLDGVPLFGAPDSVTYSYTNFGGENFTSTAAAAPSFGSFTAPTAISASRGCQIGYQLSQPWDSIQVYVVAVDTAAALDTSIWFQQPDNGTIVFNPGQLPYNAGIAKNGYLITVFRWNWNTQTSPSGKQIGIYSQMYAYGPLIPAKP